MKLESPLKTEFVNQLKEDGWFARRLEEKFAVGIPDIILAIPYGPGMLIEAKRILLKDSFSPSPRQKLDLDAWEAKRSQAAQSPVHRIAGVLGFKDGLWYIGAPADVLYMKDCVAQFPGERNSAFLVRYWNKRLMDA